MYILNCGNNKAFFEGIRLVTKSIFCYYKINSKKRTVFLFTEITNKKDSLFPVWKLSEFWSVYFDFEVKEVKNMNMNKRQEILTSIILKMIPMMFDLKIEVQQILSLIIDNLCKENITQVSFL